jgi:hypothetical protein
MRPGYTVFFWENTEPRWWPADSIDVDESGALWVLDAEGKPFAVFGSGVWYSVEDGCRIPIFGDDHAA